MIEASHPRLSVVRQCGLPGISRSGHYYRPTGETEQTLALMRLPEARASSGIDEAFLECPCHGSRQMVRHLHRLGHRVGRARVVRLMRRMGLAAIYQKPNTSAPHPEHRVYPYLLRDLAIVRPNQVWCSDITYIPMRRGFLYLVAVMDRHSRRVLSWRLSNTIAKRSHGVMSATPTGDVAFCTDALEEALARHGKPEAFNTDQGSQFTSLAFTQALTDAGIQISMDGRGRWMDNVFIERLWRSLKYECVYLHAFETGPALHSGLARWISHYNTHRPHSALAGRTPDEAYRGVLPTLLPGHARATASDLKAAA